MMDESAVNDQTSPIFAFPGTSLSDLPIPFHQIMKNVFGLYQSEPLNIVKNAQISTAQILKFVKSIDNM